MLGCFIALKKKKIYVQDNVQQNFIEQVDT